MRILPSVPRVTTRNVSFAMNIVLGVPQTLPARGRPTLGPSRASSRYRTVSQHERKHFAMGYILRRFATTDAFLALAVRAVANRRLAATEDATGNNLADGAGSLAGAQKCR